MVFVLSVLFFYDALRGTLANIPKRQFNEPLRIPKEADACHSCAASQTSLMYHWWSHSCRLQFINRGVPYSSLVLFSGDSDLYSSRDS